MSSALYVGLMSGTSADGVDALVVDFETSTPTLLASHSLDYPSALRQAVLTASHAQQCDPETLWQLDEQLGHFYAQCVQELLKRYPDVKANIAAIGSHGQTIRHRPTDGRPYTVQIGNPNVLAAQTGIPVVADFRRADMAWGGQGAPLAPAFHQAIFRDHSCPRVVINIGGMANMTDLTGPTTIGFDTGPGNALMDAFIQRHQPNCRFDSEGQWASTGRIHPALLARLLTHPFFTQAPPKSTGREDFHLSWLDEHLLAFNPIAPEDVQATLCELSCQSITQALKYAHNTPKEILVCGGGAKNHFLMQRLQQLQSAETKVLSTQVRGVDVQHVEAMLMAWLAKQYCDDAPGNLPSVTGASKAVVLGALYKA